MIAVARQNRIRDGRIDVLPAPPPIDLLLRGKHVIDADIVAVDIGRRGLQAAIVRVGAGAVAEGGKRRESVSAVISPQGLISDGGILFRNGAPVDGSTAAPPGRIRQVAVSHVGSNRKLLRSRKPSSVAFVIRAKKECSISAFGTRGRMTGPQRLPPKVLYAL